MDNIEERNRKKFANDNSKFGLLKLLREILDSKEKIKIVSNLAF